jgi:hypothetical protein
MPLRALERIFEGKERTMKSTMATAESTQQQNADERSLSPLNTLSSASTQFLENFVKSNTALIAGSVELARDTLTFSRTCLQANLDAWTVLLQCKNVSELSECQQELAKKTTSQYTEAASRIINRWANVIPSASVPGREQSRSV